MAGLSGAARAAVWAAAGMCAAVLVGLVVVAVAVNLDTADRTASVVGAALGAVGLFVSVFTLFRPSLGAGRTRRVQSHGRGAMAAGGNIEGNAFGPRSEVRPTPSGTPPASPAATGDMDVQAHGPGALSAGGDISRNAFGDDSSA
ncbi:hypothetical protein ACFY1L_18350 [Streptomyces sp. NPDC001663]|uniref:hypothetical protein n=1 Tax=Streptomyces sp. NPDC001663 TaxID=3364597 RepID=UPI0036D0F655